MVNYSCEKCGKTFKQRGHYMKHLQRKTPCDNIKDKIENIVEKKVEELVKEKLQDLVEKGDIEIKNKNLISNNQNSNTENTEMEITENTEMEITENKNDTKENSDIKENIKMNLYNEDCLVKMKDIQNESIDMILCDLPYGCTKNKWDIIIPFDKLWLEYNRIIKKNGAIVLFGSQPFTSQLIVSNLKMFRYCLVWEKNKFSDFLNAKRKPMKTNEDICIFYKKQPTYNPQFTYGDPYKRWNTQKAVNKQSNYGGHKENVSESKDGKRLPTTVLKFNRIERPKHPTQKPVELLEWLVKTYSNEGETVLDNCMGVGSTGHACKKNNRNFVGIELDKTYFDIAQESLFQ